MNYSTPLQGKPVQLDYLDYLIDDCNRERELSEFIKYQDETTAGITYLTPLKDFTGYLRGYYEMLSRKKYKISENKAIRSNCRNYLKIVRDKNDRIIQTETYRKGKIDCIHLHDNHGEHDEHLLPGDGTLNWQKAMKGLKSSGYDGPLTLEIVYRKDYEAMDIEETAMRLNYTESITSKAATVRLIMKKKA